jgi:nucleotide-binding universal stress UspA family protein
MDRLRTGSIAERVGTRAAQPVLIVPERARPAGVHPSIVVAVDFSRASDNALEHAVGFAAGIGGTVTLVHVIPEALAVSAPDALYPGALDYQHLLVRDAWRRLQESTPSLRAPDTTARARVLTGDPASAIARFADGVHADLIVVGLTRRGAVSRVVFGATAARLMRVASQPVLVIPEDFSHERYVDERSRSHAA